ncbi:MAG: hypothetical protein U0235_28045 [Polyangiaceae bacterium]
MTALPERGANLDPTALRDRCQMPSSRRRSLEEEAFTREVDHAIAGAEIRIERELAVLHLHERVERVGAGELAVPRVDHRAALEVNLAGVLPVLEVQAPGFAALREDLDEIGQPHLAEGARDAAHLLGGRARGRALIEHGFQLRDEHVGLRGLGHEIEHAELESLLRVVANDAARVDDPRRRLPQR